MHIAVVSYDEGAGRTTLARHLFMAAGRMPVEGAVLAGFDMEKPDLLHAFNGLHFDAGAVYADIPSILKAECRYCGWCADYCPSEAIRFNREQPSVTIDPRRCQACGDCLAACAKGLITTRPAVAGILMHGRVQEGNIWLASADDRAEFLLPLVWALHEKLNGHDSVVSDLPPGINPLVRASLKTAGGAIIVVKPSGEWDEKLIRMAEFLGQAGVPAGVLVNRVRPGDSLPDEVRLFCREKQLPFYGYVPYLDTLASMQPFAAAYHIEINYIFSSLWNKVHLPAL